MLITLQSGTSSSYRNILHGGIVYHKIVPRAFSNTANSTLRKITRSVISLQIFVKYPFWWILLLISSTKINVFQNAISKKHFTVGSITTNLYLLETAIYH